MKGKDPAFQYEPRYGWWEERKGDGYTVITKSLFFDKDTKLITK